MLSDVRDKYRPGLTFLLKSVLYAIMRAVWSISTCEFDVLSAVRSKDWHLPYATSRKWIPKRSHLEIMKKTSLEDPFSFSEFCYK